MEFLPVIYIVRTVSQRWHVTGHIVV